MATEDLESALAKAKYRASKVTRDMSEELFFEEEDSRDEALLLTPEVLIFHLGMEGETTSGQDEYSVPKKSSSGRRF